MTRRLAVLLLSVILAAGLYATVPVDSATPAPGIPPGAVLVQAVMWDGMSWLPVQGGIAIPPLACAP